MGPDVNFLDYRREMSVMLDVLKQLGIPEVMSFYEAELAGGIIVIVVCSPQAEVNGEPREEKRTSEIAEQS